MTYFRRNGLKLGYTSWTSLFTNAAPAYAVLGPRGGRQWSRCCRHGAIYSGWPSQSLQQMYGEPRPINISNSSDQTITPILLLRGRPGPWPRRLQTTLYSLEVGAVKLTDDGTTIIWAPTMTPALVWDNLQQQLRSLAATTVRRCHNDQPATDAFPAECDLDTDRKPSEHLLPGIQLAGV